MPMPCRTTSAAVMSVPETLRPFSSQVKVTKIGLSLTLRTASTAARASERVIMVSMTNRSTPGAFQTGGLLGVDVHQLLEGHVAQRGEERAGGGHIACPQGLPCTAWADSSARRPVVVGGAS